MNGISRPGLRPGRAFDGQSGNTATTTILPQSSAGRSDSGAAIAFLTWLTGPYTDSTDWRLELRGLLPQWKDPGLGTDGKPGGRMRARQWFELTPEGIVAAAKTALRWGERFDVYHGCLPRAGEKGTRLDVPAAACLWCEIDGGPDPALQLLRRRVDAGAVPAPHALIVSGGGVHSYWRLAEPWPIFTSDPQQSIQHCDRFKRRLKRLVKALGDDPETGAHTGCERADTASVLRTPGTFNRKQEGNPRPVRLIRLAADAEAYPFSWWGAHLPVLPDLRAPEVRPSPTATDAKGALRWAARKWATTPAPEGSRHGELVRMAAWLIRDCSASREEVRELLQQKAAYSSGNRVITEAEIEEVIAWP